jgi:hypothetical protein
MSLFLSFFPLPWSFLSCLEFHLPPVHRHRHHHQRPPFHEEKKF